eukprot:Gb_41216 [translate_table: standard]
MTNGKCEVRISWIALAVVLCCLGIGDATNPDDVEVMQKLAKNLNAGRVLGWTGDDPCLWKMVACSTDRVVGIQVTNRNLQGSLPADFNKLTALSHIGFQSNQLSGELPSFSGMTALQTVYLNDNNFSSIPNDFFSGIPNLQVMALDNNPLAPWVIPDDLKTATTLVNFTANNASVIGSIPDFFGDALVNMQMLGLAFNNLSGGIPQTFKDSNLEILWLNNQQGSKLNGSIEVVAAMKEITQLWLQSNAFTGAIPDFSKCPALKDLRLRDNKLTGLVPESLTTLASLQNVSLTNNALQGPYPRFPNSVGVDNDPNSNSFCLPYPGPCGSRVNVLLDFAQDVGYPYFLASDWQGNNPCSGWLYVTCDGQGNITVLNLAGLKLIGTISPALSNLTSLTTLLLSNNGLTGSIPTELTTLPNLEKLDVSNNKLSGKIPAFRLNVVVNVDGNPEIGKNQSPSSPGAPTQSPGSSGPRPGASTNSTGNGAGSNGNNKNGSSTPVGVIVGPVVGASFALGIAGAVGFCFYKRRQRWGRVQNPNAVTVHPGHSGSDPEMLKFTIAGQSVNSTMSETQSRGSSGPSDVQVVEAGNMTISIQVLRSVTNDFSEENILGRGGFGVVYKGELHDGTKIAVKRMEAGVMSSKGFSEFQAEIAVLTKVRHRHLVALLGYCVEGNERLLVYEYMPQGPLSHHLFDWAKHDLKPLDWKKRLSIALDVARGVEYLHSLAHKSFIHRDLKPSNILLGDDMRAKVSDFGLVRLAPEGKYSVETRLAGTFGYLAPEYAVTGRVTTKADVFSFGVVLMELITGRRALDETQPEESMHLVTWFRRMHLNKDNFRNAIDAVLEITDDETFKSICTVAELAGHCTAREPYQRPDMGHAVNVLSPLVEKWKPTDQDFEDCYGIDLDMTLPQALKKWQAFEDSNVDDSVRSVDNTQSSIPTRPSGFADSFTSADGR